MTKEVIIMGAGPAGYMAAIYLARANLQPLLIRGKIPGGQLLTTSDVENFPGFPEGVQGPELMDLMAKQAMRFGTEFIDDFVTTVNFASGISLCVEDKVLTTKALIVATGAAARWLGVPGETEYQGKGVSACATCDGFFFRNKKVVVIGGGNSAVEEAIFLTKFAEEVHVLHRGGSFRAENILVERLNNNPKIKVHWYKEVRKFMGNGQKLTDVLLNDDTILAIDGAFVAIGHDPATKLLQNKLDLDDRGYIKVKADLSTSIKGVYAAGDVCDPYYRQAVTAAGQGCIAALEVQKFLDTSSAEMKNAI